MHLLETEFPRIFASEDAICRWADPWFLVIDEYAPPGHNIAVVSGKDWPRKYHPSFANDPSVQLMHDFSCAAIDEIVFTIEYYLALKRHEIRFGRYVFFNEEKLHLLFVDPCESQPRNDMCLLHELKHAGQRPVERTWANQVRNEMEADTFAYEQYARFYPNADVWRQIDLANRHFGAYSHPIKQENIYFPAIGPYLDAAFGSASMNVMQSIYFSLHQRVQGATLQVCGDMLKVLPLDNKIMADAAESVLRREPKHSGIYPYAKHLLESQKFLLSLT